MRPAQARHSLRHATPWVRRFGLGGFLFFLAKGLAWLAVPAMLAVSGVE